MNDSPLEPPQHLVASLVLVRHGESTWVAEGRFQGRGDPPLSQLGRRQADLVAQRLAQAGDSVPLPVPGGPPRAIWHSPLARAAQTAQLIAGRQAEPPPLRAHEGLTELAQGEWEGLLHSEVRARWPDELAAWRRSPATAHAPGGEPLLEAAVRVRAAISEGLALLAGTNAGGPVPAPDDAADLAAVVRDPVPGYPTTAPAEGPEPWLTLVAHDGIFRLLSMSMLGVAYERFWSFPFNLCAISVISLSGGVAALRAHNLAEHLAPLAAEERAAQEARGDRRGAL